MMQFLSGSRAKATGATTSITPTARIQLLSAAPCGVDLVVVAADLTSSITIGNQFWPPIACGRLFCRAGAN
jgi:hypothetical protein